MMLRQLWWQPFFSPGSASTQAGPTFSESWAFPVIVSPDVTLTMVPNPNDKALWGRIYPDNR